MTTSTWFDDVPVLGNLPREEAVAKLRELGETEAAAALEKGPDSSDRGAGTFGAHRKNNPGREKRSSAGRSGSWWPFGNRAWQHTAHAFGYLAPGPPGDEPVPIQHAGNIEADGTLKDGRVKITLNRLRVADYPGGGTHRILFDFYAQNQVPDHVEHLHFNSTFRAAEGERVAVIGYPIFVGLNVGTEGVAFRCFTVNVKNDDDEGFLAAMESDVFKAGLKLINTVQPAIAPLSEMAVGLTKSIAKRHRNVPVQDFYMGLDFTNILTGARLREGAYLAVQIPETFERVWRWDDWVYDPTSGQVVNKSDSAELIPYNYVVFGVSRYG